MGNNRRGDRTGNPHELSEIERACLAALRDVLHEVVQQIRDTLASRSRGAARNAMRSLSNARGIERALRDQLSNKEAA